jgi:hypothetical protein
MILPRGRRSGQPVYSTVRRKDDVEGLRCFQHAFNVIEIAAQEFAGHPSFGAELPRCLDPLRRKVDTRHPCPTARPGKRIESEVALQVQERLASHIAHLHHFDAMQPASPALKSSTP